MTDEKKRGLFARFREGLQKTRSSLTHAIDQLTGYYKELDDDFYDDLEGALIGADVGVKTTTSIIEQLRKEVIDRRISEPAKVKELLREILVKRMDTAAFDPAKPAVVMVVGVNGVGKTTQIGKLACRFKADGRKVLLAAADTFRAAAAEQLTVWAQRADVPIVAHKEGADPAAVVFDAMTAARARGCDLVFVDTAGRLHNKGRLMEELKKIRRVIDREKGEYTIYTLLVIDGTTGQNGITQARVFQEAVQLDGILLTKLDGTAKGGVTLCVRDELGIPVYFIGVGEQLDDLQPFDAEAYASAIL